MRDICLPPVATDSDNSDSEEDSFPEKEDEIFLRSIGRHVLLMAIMYAIT